MIFVSFLTEKNYLRRPAKPTAMSHLLATSKDALELKNLELQDRKRELEDQRVRNSRERANNANET